jgi:hypothetical protein
MRQRGRVAPGDPAGDATHEFPYLVASSRGFGEQMRRVALICLCAVALSSCVSVDSALTVRADGSGTLALAYRVSRSLADFGASGDSIRSVPLPVERSDFQQALAAAPGVRLERYRRSVGEKDVTVHATLAFDAVADLAKLAPLAGSGLALASDGAGHFTFTETLYRAGQSAVTPDSEAMVDSLFAGSDVSLSLTAPARITGHSIGSVSGDGRTLTWRSTVPDLLRADKDVVLTATW